MKKITNYIEQESPFDGESVEPFGAIMNLTAEYGVLELIKALQMICTFESEENALCPKCRGKATWLATELTELIRNYEQSFPTARNRINSPDAGILQ